jgi:hypothetical protein
MLELFRGMVDFLKESDVIKDNNASLHKNLDISNWDVSSVTDMELMFRYAVNFLKESPDHLKRCSEYVIKDNNASLHKNQDIGAGLISKILV